MDDGSVLRILVQTHATEAVSQGTTICLLQSFGLRQNPSALCLTDRVLMQSLRCVVLGTESAAEVWCESADASQLLVSFHGDRLTTWAAAVEWSGRFCNRLQFLPCGQNSEKSL